MRKVALTAAFLSVSTLIAGCGDDYPSNVDANVVYVYPDAGPQGGASGGGDAGCPTATFITPALSAKLTAADDVDDQCKANGFQIDVKLAVGAPDGTAVTLLVNNTPVGTPGVVAGGTVVFKAVSLGTTGAPSALVAQIGSVAGCSATNNVTVDCSAVTCSIAKPVTSEAHPNLNGVPSLSGGDRVGAEGSAYQVAFEVTTNIEDGRKPILSVQKTGSGVVSTVMATAMGGKATFAGVAFPTDGEYTVTASCTSAVGATGTSEKKFIVDTTPPDLTIASPAAGKHFGPGELTAGAFKVCGQTTSADAVGVSSAILGGKNFAVTVLGVKGSAPVSAGAPGGNACVDVACPGGAAFDATVVLFDGAGNSTQKTITGISCASTSPTISIVSPAGDSKPYADQAKRLLSAGSVQTFKDSDSTKAGAQTSVTVCTDKAGATAELFVGPELADSTDDAAKLVNKSKKETTVTVQAAVAGDGCPNGLGFVAKWAAATINESAGDPSTGTGTELVVKITDPSSETKVSGQTRVWVDSLAPNLDYVAPLNDPGSVCGKEYSTPGVDYVRDLQFSSVSDAAVLTLSGATTYTQTTTNNTLYAIFTGVRFASGITNLTLTATDASGNSRSFQTPCTVKVGRIPIVTWQSPSGGKKLCASTNTNADCVADVDAVAPGWQGTLRVKVESEVGTLATTGSVVFNVGGVDLPPASISGSGIAEALGVTIPDGSAVTLKATTSDISGDGVGSASLVVPVDTAVPGIPATFVIDPDKDRRGGKFHLSWSAPADGTGVVSKYEIRYAKVPLNAANFSDLSVATDVPWAGSPSASGGIDSIDVPGLTIGQDYYFAVRAIDGAGNPSDLLASTTASASQFRSTTVTAGTIGKQFGTSLDGSTDINGDGLSDLLVGSGTDTKAHIFFGKASFETAPSVGITIEGPGTSGFGFSFIAAGKLDGDQFPDLVIADPNSSMAGFYVIWGRSDTDWKSKPVLRVSNGITDGITSLDLGYTSSDKAWSMAKLGDFDGDGRDDFAVGAFGYASSQGRVTIVLGDNNLRTGTYRLIHVTGTGPGTNFGTKVQGIGRVYGATGTTVLVSATLASTGSLFALQGFAAPATVAGSATTASYSLSTAPAELKKVYTVPGSVNYGNGLVYAGVFNNKIGILAGPGSTLGGSVDLWLGTAADLFPVASSLKFTNSAASGRPGVILGGGGFSGDATSLSLIGDASPDIVIASQSEGGKPPRLFILDGANLPSGGTSVDLNATTLTGEVVSQIPQADALKYNGLPPVFQRSGSGLLRDITGDQSPDFAVPGIAAASTSPDTVIIFW